MLTRNRLTLWLHFECEEEKHIPEFVKSIRVIRSVLSIINPTIYKLWDDISQYIRKKRMPKYIALKT